MTKLIFAKRLSAEASNTRSSYKSSFNPFINKVAIRFNMFGLLADEINKNMEYYFVVTIKSHLAIMVDAKVPKKLLKQNEFTCGMWRSTESRRG